MPRPGSLCVAVVAVLLAGCPTFENERPPSPPTETLEPTAEAEPGPVDADAPEEFTSTPSGLKYRIRRRSDGPTPKATDTVLAHYKGWLDDGTVFDSSYRRGEPTSFALNQVIDGWTEGLQLIGKGGMIELEIPSELGYGKKGMPPDIPSDATLHFLVELIDIY